MGIVMSTLLSLAVQIAWNCQRFLDPRYRYIEPTVSPDNSSTSVCQFKSKINTEKHNADSSGITNQVTVDGVRNNSTHQQSRNRRAAQLRYRRKRRSSFDAALIIRSMNKNGINPYASHRVISSTPNTLTRQQAPKWSNTSSSSYSSSSSVSSSEDSDAEQVKNTEKTEEKVENKNPTESEKYLDNNDDHILDEKQTMTAAEEAAFRMTLARGHFSKSKKDKFLNNLRLEKRFNDLSHEFFEPAFRIHSRRLYRHHSGDLKKIV